MVVLKESGGCQPILNLPHTSYPDKDANEVVTFKFFHGAVSLTSSQVGNDSSDPRYSCSEDDDSSDPDFEDNDYAQSDEEIDLLKKYDKWFEVYVDYTCTDNDPNAEENDESDSALTCPSSSSSEDEALGELRRKRNRMPKVKISNLKLVRQTQDSKWV
ncbi:unnamed protein product [Prunus brigantina]